MGRTKPTRATMKGIRKSRKGESTKTPGEIVASDTLSSQATENANPVPDSDVATVSLLTVEFFPSPPKRGRRWMGQTQEARLTSTPVHSSSTDVLSSISQTPTKAKQTSEVESPWSRIKTQSRRRKADASQPRAVLKRLVKEPAQTCSPTNAPAAECRRGRTRMGPTQEARLTSTPVHSSSTDVLSSISQSPTEAKQTSEGDSPCSQSNEIKTQSRCRGADASQPGAVLKRLVKEPAQTCSPTNAPAAECRRGRTRKAQKDATAPIAKRLRPRFELETLDSSSEDESLLLSSDFSIERSRHEEPPPPLSFKEDEGSEEDELPSFLMQVDKKPITGGVFVWHKFRNHPFWPALVKSVNRKHKKASIMFIDDPCITKKGFTVALKTLKPFDCEEADELRCKAKEKYNAAMEWSWELITDYRIRIACGSFSGSFIEYFAHDMSYPVRRTYPQAASERLTITSDPMVEALGGGHKEDRSSEQHEEVGRSLKRLLPDRSHAAHNRANEKLVHFIVKQRMADERLLAVIRGQQQSRWLRSFQSASRRRVVNIYLEDDQQLDQVYWYLNELYATAGATAPLLAEIKSMEERVPFVLDVLLPEAIIYAIAGVDNVTVKKAEEKYLKGRCISNRERQEFDLMIDRQMRKKSKRQNACVAHCADTIS
ncbi:PWWP domain-containing DNA repair factor 3A isoform X2 [Pseudoliparis swirei]|uniref:PWWP domain-containing DNA repair factor 3A isoform X2 n=1 Tax=Pseudoliparis swirei TaxID=2059687 RepID=UPI0024BDD8D4|nr:PWWP domain-containing DNA repair factor 3A isoform X2 [Pseudoliparis swirei]